MSEFEKRAQIINNTSIQYEYFIFYSLPTSLFITSTLELEKNSSSVIKEKMQSMFHIMTYKNNVKANECGG